jgi:hypothetical protein
MAAGLSVASLGAGFDGAVADDAVCALSSATPSPVVAAPQAVMPTPIASAYKMNTERMGILSSSARVGDRPGLHRSPRPRKIPAAPQIGLARAAFPSRASRFQISRASSGRACAGRGIARRARGAIGRREAADASANRAIASLGGGRRAVRVAHALHASSRRYVAHAQVTKDAALDFGAAQNAVAARRVAEGRRRHAVGEALARVYAASRLELALGVRAAVAIDTALDAAMERDVAPLFAARCALRVHDARHALAGHRVAMERGERAVFVHGASRVRRRFGGRRFGGRRFGGRRFEGRRFRGRRFGGRGVGRSAGVGAGVDGSDVVEANLAVARAAQNTRGDHDRSQRARCA